MSRSARPHARRVAFALARACGQRYAPSMPAVRSTPTRHVVLIIVLASVPYLGSLRASSCRTTCKRSWRSRASARWRRRTFERSSRPATSPTTYRSRSCRSRSVANALLLYLLLLRLGESTGLALAVTLLWAVHPVQVESVAWISERKNVPSTLFFLLAFLAYLRFSDRPRQRDVLCVIPGGTRAEELIVGRASLVLRALESRTGIPAARRHGARAHGTRARPQHPSPVQRLGRRVGAARARRARARRPAAADRRHAMNGSRACGRLRHADCARDRRSTTT
jgi:hypothetical protein